MHGRSPVAGCPTTVSNTTEENARQSVQKEEALQRVMEGFEQILQDSAHDFQVCLLHGSLSFSGLSSSCIYLEKKNAVAYYI
jgi:hypothetical protein